MSETSPIRSPATPRPTSGAPRYAHVIGWGSYAPAQVLTNADLERMVDTSDEWIVSRTGIRERRVAAAHETTASMAAVASLRAIRTAGIEPDDIDVILLATLTPDYWMPSTAALVKEAIGNTRAAAMDVAAACSGFVYGYATGQAYIASGMARNVLVIGAETLTRFLDYSDRNTCILFGDGAGAVVLGAADTPGGGLGIEMTTEPEGAYMIWLPAGGAKRPPSAETIARGEHFVRMEGKETYRFATRTLASTALAAIDRAGLKSSDIDLFIPHQANIQRCWRDRMDRRSGTRPSRRRRSQPGGRARSIAGRLGFGRPDPGRARCGHGPARRTRCRRAARRRRAGRAGACPPRPQDRDPGVIDLSGKSAVVTGGSRGLGRAIALRLARQGADVAFSYRGNEVAADETASGIEEAGRKALAVQADVTDPPAAEALVKAALEAFGKVDILVNNAGITRDDLIMRMSLDAWREVLETNLFGAFYTIKSATRPMLKARGGRIVNITSVSGQAGQTGQANYSAAKAGLIGLTKATARELASRGITCNAVAPGFVLTELTQGLPDALKAELTARTPLGRFGTAEEIADAVAFLASDEAAFITGQVLAVDGGLVMM